MGVLAGRHTGSSWGAAIFLGPGDVMVAALPASVGSVGTPIFQTRMRRSYEAETRVLPPYEEEAGVVWSCPLPNTSFHV